MKSTWFKNRAHYEFAKHIHDADFGNNLYDNFTRFLQCCTYSLTQAGRVFVGEPISEEIETKYKETISRIKHPEEFPKAFAALVNALEETPSDFLGDVFQAIGLNDSAFKGQVFTPDGLTQLLAKISLGNETPDGYSLINRMMIAEPACGGGAMIIQASETLKKNGFSPRQFFIVASDVDHKCVQMCFIQLYLLGVPAVIEHRNTLSRECWGRFPTLAALEWPLFDKNNPDVCNIN